MTAQPNYHYHNEDSQEFDFYGYELEDSFEPEEEHQFNEIFSSLQRDAEERKKLNKRLQVAGTAAIGLICLTVVGGFTLIVNLTKAPPDARTQLSAQLVTELEKQANWISLNQKTDNTIFLAPMQANPGYRQVLALNLGAKLRGRLNNQLNDLNDPNNPCSRRGQTIESCAAIEELNVVDQIRYQALAGKPYYLASVDDNGRIKVERQLTTEEILDNATLRKWALDAAVTMISYQPPIDPFADDQAREELIKARMERLKSENKTDSAIEIAKRVAALSSLRDLPTKQEAIEIEKQSYYDDEGFVSVPEQIQTPPSPQVPPQATKVSPKNNTKQARPAKTQQNSKPSNKLNNKKQ